MADLDTQGKEPDIREGVYGILIREGRVLMCHSKSKSRIIINFPGGAVDGGETLEEALKREFLEETGAALTNFEHIYTSDGTHVNPDYPENRQLCHYYLVTTSDIFSCDGNCRDVECLEWFSLDDLPFEQMLPVDRDFSVRLKKEMLWRQNM